MTVREAAAVLGVTPEAVRKRAQRGLLLGAARRGRDWDIPASAVAAILAVRAERSRSERTPAA